MTIIATGIDLAKNVFAVHGVSAAGAVQLRQPKVARAKLNALIASLPPGVIGMEACSGAHYWARQLQAHGHTVRLIAPKLVTPYRLSGTRAREHLGDLPGFANLVIGDPLSEVTHLDERIAQYDKHVLAMARQSNAAQQLMQLMGIGEATATTLVAIAAKNARMAWAVLTKGEAFKLAA